MKKQISHFFSVVFFSTSSIIFCNLNCNSNFQLIKFNGVYNSKIKTQFLFNKCILINYNCQMPEIREKWNSRKKNSGNWESEWYGDNSGNLKNRKSRKWVSGKWQHLFGYCTILLYYYISNVHINFKSFENFT